MKNSAKIGLSFGITSGVITTLGLIVGLHAGTNSRIAVLGGIITIAIADGLSDSYGIRMSEEFGSSHSVHDIWISTVITFLSKFLLAMSFVVFFFVFEMLAAVIASILYGMLIIGTLTYFMAKQRHIPIYTAIGQHVGMAIFVVVITHYLGLMIATFL